MPHYFEIQDLSVYYGSGKKNPVDRRSPVYNNQRRALTIIDYIHNVLKMQVLLKYKQYHYN